MAETIGLDIGSHSIKLVGLKMTLKGPVITHAGIKEIPYGEEREDLDFISETVKGLYREIGLQPGKVSLSVSGSGVFIRQITIPSMPKAELKEAVRWEIKEYLPFPVESAQIDFFILHEFVEDNVKKLDVIVVACPKNLIDRTLSIAEGAGLKPVHLDICPFAIWNTLLISGQLAKEEVIALIELGDEKTVIHLFRNGVLQFAREITPAGEDITRAIMEGIVSDKEPRLIYERAEKIKQEMDIFPKTPHEKARDKSIDFSKISFLVRPVLERLTVEIGRSLDYYKNQFHVERIDRLLLTGGGSNLVDIASCLSGELRLPVEQFIPFRKILFDSKKIDPQVSQLLEPMSALFTVATGIALPETKRIELLPVKPAYWSIARMEKLIPIFSSIVTLIVFLWIFLQMSGQMSVIKKEHDEKMTKVKTLEALQAKLIVLKDKENRMKQDLSLIPSSVIVQVPFQEVLLEVGRIVPDNVTVSLLSVQDKPDTSKKETQTKEREELQIKGIAFGSDLQCLTALAQIIERLEKSPLFKNARLVTADENKLYNQPATEFEIVCDIEG
ncbi:MAG: type IV pilus assembly protein PilM [Nitrospirota bacterium]